MNNSIQQEIKALTPQLIENIKTDYCRGTGLTIRDLERKYALSFATICYIVKSL